MQSSWSDLSVSALLKGTIVMPYGSFRVGIEPATFWLAFSCFHHAIPTTWSITSNSNALHLTNSCQSNRLACSWTSYSILQQQNQTLKSPGNLSHLHRDWPQLPSGLSCQRAGRGSYFTFKGGGNDQPHYLTCSQLAYVFLFKCDNSILRVTWSVIYLIHKWTV